MKKIKFLGILMMLMFVSTAFVACGDDDDEVSGNVTALVGTWTQQHNNYVIGIKLTANGKAYYNEWGTGEELNFNNVSTPANVKFTETTIRITHSQVPGYYEEYSYILSEDGKSITFTLLDWEKDNHGLSGTFTKYE